MRMFHRRRGDGGAAVVEFALIFPVLCLLVFGMIDFGWAINRYAVVSNAAREGVRLASVGAEPDEINAAVLAAVSDTGGGSATVTVSCLRPNGTACGTYSNAETGGTAIVTVNYSGNWLTPVGATFSPGMSLVKASRMRIE